MKKGDLIALIAFAIFSITALVQLIILIIWVVLPPILFFIFGGILGISMLCILIMAMFAEPSLELKKNKNKASQ